jgi:hypothetical protein
MFLVVNLLTLTAFAASGKISLATSKDAVIVNNSNELYNTIKNAVKLKNESIIIYAKDYSKTTYNIDKTIKQVIDDCFTLDYIISSYEAKHSWKFGSYNRTINITIFYKPVDGVANNYDEFLKIMEKEAIIKGKDKISIKVKGNDSSILDNVFNVGEKINEKVTDNRRITSLSVAKNTFPDTKILVLEYNLSYKDKADASSSNVDINKNKQLYEGMKTAIENCETSFFVKQNINYTEDEFKKLTDSIEGIISKVLEENYDIHYYFDSYQISYIKEGSSIKEVSILFEYSIDRESILRINREVENKINEIVDLIIIPGMTDLEKEIAVHNYIVNNTKYDEANYEKGTVPKEANTAYGVLIKGVGVCGGYASAMNKLFSAVDIESMIISGEAGENGSYEAHAWNLVKLDGEYYHIDATWNDPIYTFNGVRKDVIHFDYFNLSDEEISKDHKWDRDKYPECIATKYRYKGK